MKKDIVRKPIAAWSDEEKAEFVDLYDCNGDILQFVIDRSLNPQAVCTFYNLLVAKYASKLADTSKKDVFSLIEREFFLVVYSHHSGLTRCL